MGFTRGRVYLALAWLSLLGLVVQVLPWFDAPVVIATGWELPNSPTSLMTWTMLAANFPALIESTIPGVAAWVFGQLARRTGERRGAVPAWIGAASVAACILLWIISALPAF